jgi:hypothetical protein
MYCRPIIVIARIAPALTGEKSPIPVLRRPASVFRTVQLVSVPLLDMAPVGTAKEGVIWDDGKNPVDFDQQESPG